MMKICLDTNAILDICYRYYPFEKFQWIWDGLQACKCSGFISFYICDSVQEEVRDQIDRFGYNSDDYDHFLNCFKPIHVSPDEHGQVTLDLKNTLMECPIAEKSPHVEQDNYADLDIVSLGKHLNVHGYVLTSEQANPNIYWNKSKAHKGIKVPNLAEKFGVKCGAWINLFDELNIYP